MQLESSERFATRNAPILLQRPTWSLVSGKASPKTRRRPDNRDIEAMRSVSNSGIEGRNRHFGVLRQRTFALATGMDENQNLGSGSGEPRTAARTTSHPRSLPPSPTWSIIQPQSMFRWETSVERYAAAACADR